MLENQGLLGIAFFEASAFVILLVLFPLFRREQPGGYFRFWHAGWFCFTFSAVFEVIFLARPLAGLHLASGRARKITSKTAENVKQNHPACQKRK